MRQLLGFPVDLSNTEAYPLRMGCASNAEQSQGQALGYVLQSDPETWAVSFEANGSSIGHLVKCPITCLSLVHYVKAIRELTLSCPKDPELKG